MKMTAEDYKAERNIAIALLAETAALMQQVTREHQQAYAALDELRNAFWEADNNREQWQAAGAQALMEAFPHMLEDYTESFFMKLAGIVLNAAPQDQP